VGVLLLLFIPHDEVIPRASKAVYPPAVLSCEKAEGLIDSDPGRRPGCSARSQ
jgi:hypothetical protein